MRARTALLAAALAALVAPGAASAHLRTGTVAVAYRAAVSAPRPAPGAPWRVGVYASDLALHLTVRPGHTVVVRGYLGEPFLRLGPAGLDVDLASPTAAATGLLGKHPVRGRGWRLQPGVRTATWHDVRVQSLPHGADHARWTIPVVVDGRPARIAGETFRLPAPALWPWLAVLGALAAAAVAIARARRLEGAAIVLGSAAAVAAVLTAAGFVLDAYASPGTWIEGIDETMFAAAAGAAAVWAPPRWRVAAGGGLGLLALAVGLSKGAIFLDADVLSVFPAALARLLACVAVGAGTASAASAGLWLSRRPLW